MIKTLLVRGLLVGLLAGLVAGAFAFFLGEPHVDSAIALEEAAPTGHASGEPGHDHGEGASEGHGHGDEAVVSRPVQRAGLFLATGLYGVAVGGVFALAFAGLRGRVGPRSEPLLAVAAAATAFAAIVLIPFLKYPANPPAVGDPATINARTLLYVVMVVVGLASVAIGVAATRRVTVRETWARALVGGVCFLVPVVAAWALLPTVDEVPAGFPASLLWDFRVASLGTQLVFWAAFGALFAVAGERAKARVS
ncbi:CbtA family protein [Nonomuraea africana]|uniref:Cobalt transporter CbtA n=1 Tax=Nonomuraea africana TaxID=46171 RepID=A0ABR9KU21_9ACTN|nr:CbtA family protein [Nonomuraea africana]MBE1565531.1 putative cobalt transporter CbtA [Nonomuraea africana]